MKRTAVLLVCLAVVLAGCTGAGVGDGSGAGGGDAGDGGGGGDGAAAGAEGSGSGSVGSDDDVDGNVANSPPLTGTDPWFDLGEPGRYVIEVDTWDVTGITTERMVYETTDVSGGMATVTFTHELLVYGGESITGEEPTAVTVTGPVETVEEALFEEDYSASIVPFTLEIAQDGMVGEFDGDLAVGQRVERTVGSNETVLEVVGVGSYGGVECHVVHEYYNGDLRGETCTSTAFRMSPYVVTYDETGSENFRVELLEYERR